MRATFIVGIVLLAAGAGLGAQDSLSTAKDLYASAAYEDALSTLTRMDGGSNAPEVARQVDQYRAFCLYALGRTGEAESIAESMIRREPLARLDADASPRLELMFSDVRRRLLPTLIRERFRTARSAFEQKSFSTAEPPLTEARLMLAEAEKLGVKDEGLGDLSVLIDGFLQLIRSSAEQRAAAQLTAAAADPAATAASAPAPGSVAPLPPAPLAPTPLAPARPVSAPPASTAASRPLNVSRAPAAATTGPRIYSVDDEGVSPPVALEQRIPPMTNEMQVVTKALKSTGILDVVIDETGQVVDATIRQSMNASFDTLVVRTARRWKYRPAMKDGVPVRFVKTLVLVP
jgi:TonB family protein